jgi:hypothetical protein
MQYHTHRLQSSLIHQNKVTIRPYLHDEICKITHTHIIVIIDTSEQVYNAPISSWRDMQNHTHTSILLAGRRSCCTWSLNKLHLLMARLAIRPQSFLNLHFCFQWSLDKGWRIVHPEKNDHWTQDEIVHPDARRFWATYPGHCYKEGVCHKNSSRSCVRGASNPITPITRILLATERSRRKKKREKQKLAPYKIYSLRHR